MCFACGPDNPIGLKIRYTVDSDEVCTAEFTPNANHLSWEDTVHGGIIYSALAGKIEQHRGQFWTVVALTIVLTLYSAFLIFSHG